jgi:arylsulfatase A-like enzyme
MLHVPGVKAKKIEGFAQNVDIAPTILNYLGEKTKIKLSGFSLKPLIKKGAGKRNKIFAYDCFSNETSCVRTKKEKLILSKNPKCYLCKANHHKGKEYYKIEKDNEEKNNLYKPGNKLEKFLEVKNG